MATPDYLYVPGIDYTQFQGSATTNLFLFPGGISRGSGAASPKHGIGINGANATASRQQKSFTGGAASVSAVAQVDSLVVSDYTKLIAGSSKLYVNAADGTRYTFTFIANGGTPSATQIEIGTTNAETATNIKEDALDAVVTATDLGSVSVSSTTVTITGLASGAAFEIQTNTPAGLTNTTTTAGVTATSATAATCALNFNGSIWVANTQNLITLPLTINSTPDFLQLIVFTPTYDESGVAVTSSTGGNALANCVLRVLAYALDGEQPPSTLGIVRSRNKATRGQIATALQGILGTAIFTAATISSSTLTLHYTSTGTAGNGQQVITAVLPGKPSVTIEVGSANAPIINGVGAGISLGGIRNFSPKLTPETGVTKIDNLAIDFGTALLGNAFEGSFELTQLRNPDFLSMVSNQLQSFTAGQTILNLGGNSNLEVYGMVALQPSATQNQFNGFNFYQVQFTGGLQFALARSADQNIPVNFTALPADSPDSIGFSFYFEEIA